MIITEKYRYSRNKIVQAKPIVVNRFYRINTKVGKDKIIDKVYSYTAPNSGLKKPSQLNLFPTNRFEEFCNIVNCLPTTFGCEPEPLFLEPFDVMEVYYKKSANDLYVIAHNDDDILVLCFTGQARRYKAIFGAFSRPPLLDKLFLLDAKATLIHKTYSSSITSVNIA